MIGTAVSDKFSAYAFLEVVVNSDKFIGELEIAENKVRTFARACARFGDPIQNIGEKMLAPFVEGVKAFAEYDDVMRRVGAVTGATGDNLKERNDLARELGASTAFTSSQVASGMQSLGMMGFFPKEIKEATGTIMNLSQATGTDSATAAAHLLAATHRHNGGETSNPVD